MDTKQFCLMTYQWIFANVVPAIAPKTLQQQLIAFKKGREIMDKLAMLANTLEKDESGGVDLNDFEKRIDDMFNVDPVLSIQINEPLLALIEISPEHTLRFRKADVDSLLAALRGRTATTQVTL